MVVLLVHHLDGDQRLHILVGVLQGPLSEISLYILRSPRCVVNCDCWLFLHSCLRHTHGFWYLQFLGDQRVSGGVLSRFAMAYLRAVVYPQNKKRDVFSPQKKNRGPYLLCNVRFPHSNVGCPASELVIGLIAWN